MEFEYGKAEILYWLHKFLLLAKIFKIRYSVSFSSSSFLICFFLGSLVIPLVWIL